MRSFRLLAALAAAALLASSCASMDWVARRTAPSIPAIKAAKAIAVMPLTVELVSTPITTVKLGPESGSQDITYDRLANTVKVVIASPAALTKYAVKAEALPAMFRDAWADFLSKDSSYDYSVLKGGFNVTRLTNADPKSGEKIAAPAYSVIKVDTAPSGDIVQAVKAVGAAQGVDLVLAGKAYAFTEVAYVTPRPVKDPVNPRADVVAGDVVLDVTAMYEVTLYDAKTGAALFTTKGYKPEFTNLDRAEIVKVPGIQEPEKMGDKYPSLIGFIKSPAYPELLRASLGATLVDYLPLFREHFAVTLEKVEK